MRLFGSLISLFLVNGETPLLARMLAMILNDLVVAAILFICRNRDNIVLVNISFGRASFCSKYVANCLHFPSCCSSIREGRKWVIGLPARFPKYINTNSNALTGLDTPVSNKYLSSNPIDVIAPLGTNGL